MRTQTIAWSDFPWRPAAQTEIPKSKSGIMFLPILTTTVTVLLIQDFAYAQTVNDAVPVMATGGGWDQAKVSILHILDYVSYGVIVFSGGSWMFGHRNKALDLLLSCGIGTVIIRHADDIENFFKSI